MMKVEFRAGSTSEATRARVTAGMKTALASLPIEPQLEPALKLAMEIGHPIYDCIYLALALHHQTHVVTADRRFAAAATAPSLTGAVRLLTA